MRRVLAWVRQRLAGVGEAFDLRDAHIYGGLLVAAVGGWQIEPALTLVAVGVILMGLGVLAPRTGR